MSDYDDRYPTCLRTYATLLIYPAGTDPVVVTARLGIEPSNWQRKGEPTTLTPGGPSRIAELDGWFLTTKDRIESRDSRRHVNWLLDQVEGKAEVLQSLRREGGRMAVSCYWLSRSGHGGPTVSPEQMRRLGRLDIELWFDVYFVGPEDDDE